MLEDLDRVIRGVIDVDLFNAELAQEKLDDRYIQAARRTVQAALKDAW